MQTKASFNWRIKFFGGIYRKFWSEQSGMTSLFVCVYMEKCLFLVRLVYMISARRAGCLPRSLSKYKLSSVFMCCKHCPALTRSRCFYGMSPDGHEKVCHINTSSRCVATVPLDVIACLWYFAWLAREILPCKHFAIIMSFWVCVRRMFLSL